LEDVMTTSSDADERAGDLERRHEPSGRLFERVSQEVGREPAKAWWNLSEETHRAAVKGDPTGVLPKLDKAASADPGSPLAPAFRLWAADALTRVRRDREAIDGYDQTISAAESAPPFEGIDFSRQALRSRAAVKARLGDLDGAIEDDRALAKRGDTEALYHAGATAERAGRFEEAASIYRELAEVAPALDSEDLGEHARRAAERLTASQAVFTVNEHGITKLVEDAIGSRDADALRRLASSTHFQVGPGAGHTRFETEEVLEWLCTDLLTSRPRRIHRGLLGTGDKRYLLTFGWRGKWFENVVGFCFERSGRGWQWDGVIVNAPADPWVARWTPTEKRSNQALTLPLLAPWPEGKYFMAGGLSLFIIQSAVIASYLWIPYVGPGLAATRAFLYSLSHCGFGLRGFYYNAGPTHTGANAFAIDFSRYHRGVPYFNASGGTPVLSPADGICRWSTGQYPSGSNWGANEVQIDHDDPVTGTPRYTTRYLHLAGRDLVYVSTAMIVPTGRRLGYIDDTGEKSVINHLHFSVHDNLASGPGIGWGVGPSVRPTPMDGNVLDDGDSGDCIKSTNREAVILPSGCGAVVLELFRRVLGGR
jgi:tetratricopeptide (TPR) repeat protein